MRHELLRKEQAQPVFSHIGAASCLVGQSYRLSRYALTHELPLLAQDRLIRAAVFSRVRGYPINTHLTINAAHLQRVGEGGVFGVGHLWDGFRDLLELMRKWLMARGVFWAAIWAREWAKTGRRGQAGEHWHIALHMPKYLHQDFAEQVANWTGEGVGAPSPSRRVAAVSVFGAWHLSTQSGRGGPENLAAYLGKAEPNTIKHYGEREPNLRKPRRDKFGGTGPIEGKRFGISKTLGTTEQGRAQYV